MATEEYDVVGEAVLSGNIDQLKKLIDSGAIATPREFWNVLYWAVMDGNLAMVKFLLTKSALIPRNTTEALIVACRYGHFEIVQYLVEYGANIHVLNEASLRHALEYPEIAHYLIDKGACLPKM